LHQVRIMIVRLRIVDATDDRHAASGRRPVLFVVDDDVPTLELIGEIARDAGWETHGFTRLTDLRGALDVERPSLLILDDELPDGRGGDLARELRHDPPLTDVPLLVCTAAHPMRRAQIGDWAPVMSKPFDLEEIERFLSAAHPARRRAESFGEAG
jgi:DNA-binding response OmpR family regulator